jgi:CheY-like chemotaxis protein
MTTLILVVDDDPVVRKLLQIFLESAGYSVVGARNGAQALECMQRLKPALVCCDLMMPEVDGFEVLKAAKADPVLATIPIVTITAAGHHNYIDRAKQLGATLCLSKPIDKVALVEVVRMLLKSSDSPK